MGLKWGIHRSRAGIFSSPGPGLVTEVGTPNEDTKDNQYLGTPFDTEGGGQPTAAFLVLTMVAMGTLLGAVAIWGFLKTEDPRVNVRFSFNTKSWSNDLDIWGYPHDFGHLHINLWSSLYPY